jgi:NADH-quinone oxidoreductase subunit N
MWNEFFQKTDYLMIIPQLELALFGLFILLTDFLVPPEQKRRQAWISLLGVGLAGYALWRMRDITLTGFAGALIVDRFYVFFGLIFLAAAALVILMSARYLEIEAEHHGEYYALVLFAAIGMLFMASGVDIVVLFISLETMAITFYILVGFFRRDRRSNEAAIKYLLLGAFSSGLLAYGFSIFYGLSNSTNLQKIGEVIANRPTDDLIVLLALVTFSAGMFFKIAAVPFHQWAPDVYEGAPTTITAYVSVASKAASFAMFLRILMTAVVPAADLWASFQYLVAVIAVATMTLGNLAAITQSNTKRLLAYSSISHVGFMLLGLVSGNDHGLQGIAIYLLVYAFMNIGAFAVIVAMRRKDLIGDEIDDLSGLFFKNPGASVLMIIFLISLAGIPPTAGFWGKYFIFLSLIETNHPILAVIAVSYVVVSLYYYFRIVVAMFMRQPTEPARAIISPGLAVALALSIAMTMLIGIYPQPFIQFAQYTLLLPFR